MPKSKGRLLQRRKRAEKKALFFVPEEWAFDCWNLVEWSVADVNGDLAQCGLSGSPTKVKAIQNIVFQAKESKTISGSDRDVEDLIVELLANHTIG